MARELPKISATDSLSELFSTEEERQEARLERVVNLRIDDIDSFKNHPFLVRDNEDMSELVESIKENGLLEPCIVRPSTNGRYEMISGHRRKHAAIRAGIENIPCIVRNLDDNQATILMVDSNKHRPYLLPSEKAFAYKMRLEAMKRLPGRPSKENVVPVGQNYSREELSGQTGESQTQIQRYIRLTYLLPELLQMVDNSVEKPDDKYALAVAMRPAVELSYLTPENQKIVLDFMEDTLTTPSHAQTIILRKMQKEGTFTASEVYNLLSEEKPNQRLTEKISVSKFERYFPANTSAATIEKEIFKALDYYREHHKQQAVERSNNEPIK